MGMMIVGAWAGAQLPVVSGTGLTIEEDLFEGHSWTLGVVLLKLEWDCFAVCVLYSIRTCQREVYN